jgi:predicted porin
MAIAVATVLTPQGSIMAQEKVSCMKKDDAKVDLTKTAGLNITKIGKVFCGEKFDRNNNEDLVKLYYVLKSMY